MLEPVPHDLVKSRLYQIVLKIRNNQYALLNLRTVLENPETFMEHASTHHPEECKGLDETKLKARVREVLTAGATFGITSTQDFLTFLDLAMVFGLDWSDKKLQWLNDGIQVSAGGSISERLRRLRLEAIYRFEAESAAP